MILADRLCADAQGRSTVAVLAAGVRKAQRFVFDLDAAFAAWQVATSKRRSVLAALPQARPPFERTWIEYPYKALFDARLAYMKEPGSGPVCTERTGFLIEAVPELTAPERPVYEVAVVWQEEGVAIPSPIGFLFCPTDRLADDEWRPVARAGIGLPPGVLDVLLRSLPPRPPNREALRPKLVENKARVGDWYDPRLDEVDAHFELAGHLLAAVPRVWWPALEAMYRENDATGAFARWCRAFGETPTGRLFGEANFLNGLLLMLHSKNAVDVREDDIAGVAKARARNRKPLLLTRRTVKISLSAVQARCGWVLSRGANPQPFQGIAPRRRLWPGPTATSTSTSVAPSSA